MAKPKLALIPAAQGSKFYSVLPSSGVGDFDFTRSGGATRINSQGLIETVGNGVSRLNYPLIDGNVVGCPSHLLENSATNLITYSEDFTQWSFKTGIGVLSNEIISVDGALNGSKIETTANGSRYVGNNYTLSTGDNTFSVFAKKGVNNWVYLNVIKDGTNNWNYTFDLQNGLIGQSNSSAYSTTAKIEDYGNGWYRCSISANVTTAGVFTARIYCADSATDVSTIVGSNVYIYGAQLEVGYPTSYIPTSGSAVTRSAETANNSGDASTFNDSEGVLMFELSAFTTDETRVISISDGSTANNIYVNVNNIGSISGQVISGGTAQCNLSSVNISQLDFNKIAITYKVNDFQLWFNGIKVASDNSGITFEDGVLNRLNFDFGTGAYDFYGNIKQIQYYDSALTDSELEKLTSWTSFSDMANGQLYSIK